MGAEDFAVVVGIMRYPGISDLDGSENDARNFRDWLVSPNGGNVAAGQVHLILSSNYPGEDDPLRARPTTLEVDGAFEKLIGVSGVGPRIALSTLSALPVAELARAIEGNDLRALSSVSGVGK